MFGLSYWFLPLFAGLVWLGTLAGMLGWWINAGSPSINTMAADQNVAYISNIGATFLKPLFIAGSAVMVVIFDATFIAERWLRHRRRLTPNYSRREYILNILAISGAVVGAAGLILLTIFDTANYGNVHDAMLGVFIAGYVVSAIFICAEYQRLGIHFREHRVLRVSFWVKLTFIIVEVGLAIGFGVTRYQNQNNVAGVLEWIIALVYIFFVWTFIIDFLPATRTKHHENRFPPVRRQNDAIAARREADGNELGGPVYTAEGAYPLADNTQYGSQQEMMETGQAANGSRQKPPQHF